MWDRARPARHAMLPGPGRHPSGPARPPGASFLATQAQALQRPADRSKAAPHARARRQPLGILGQRGVVLLAHQLDQHRRLASDQPPAAGRHLRPAPALALRRPEPALQRPFADPKAPRHLGLAALAGLTGRERSLAQVRGIGARHLSSSGMVNPTTTAHHRERSAYSNAKRSSAMTGEEGLLSYPRRLRSRASLGHSGELAIS